VVVFLGREQFVSKWNPGFGGVVAASGSLAHCCVEEIWLQKIKQTE
jgi:hypothetical protein